MGYNYMKTQPVFFINGKRYGGEPTIDMFPDIDEILADKEKTRFSLLRIPRQYARNNIAFNKRIEGLDDVECYKLYLFSQVGDYMITKRDTYIILELPSGLKVPIILYWNGGADFEPSTRKFVLREYDALDRRIIKGFCQQNDAELRELSHSELKDPIITGFLGAEAIHFSESKVNKRLKSGRTNRYPKYLFPREPYPYEESTNIFSNIVLI